MSNDTYKAQKRGGKGVKGASNDDDFFTSIFTAETHDQIMFFSDRGKVYTLKVYNIPEGTRTSKGRNIVNLIPVKKMKKLEKLFQYQKISKINI
jgi:DNA gyrase subunit A